MERQPIQRHLEEKHAGFHELFFDLIFVYAIQKIAHVILHTHGGTISADLFFKYIMMSLILWILWSHQTFFTNRFGKTSKTDVCFMMFNLFVLIFLSNSLYPSFEKTFFPFFLCVTIMYMSIGLQYLVQLRYTRYPNDYQTCKAFAIVAFTVAALSCLSLILPTHIHYYSAFLGVFVAGTGLIPFRKYLYQSPVNMMHLVERFSLLTIIIFGEVLVGLASTFSIKHFDIIYIFQFLILVSLFGIYWLVTENYINHQHKSIGFLLVYTHLVINIALGMLNTALVYSNSNELYRFFEINLLYVSIVLFLAGLWFNSSYFHAHLKIVKPIVYQIIIIIVAYMMSIVFINVGHVFVIVTAIATCLILAIYYLKVAE
ncbi:low temperature requirement protein A [Staphylococcus sp. HMSC068D08]|uniref:low temperature requirement protein A n=1 Tax=Staphylococcus TaxID=1279 RepID=UPI0008A4C7FC|nr:MULTISPECIES: low temperature requirement protein A [Staphylococcus]MCC2083105.1 low temperature requirement protein A [Staphylococcus lugdunensis]MCH8679567.1 low temperature requirement protein A [Staphylococcus lugdunensis]MCI2827845.1 low temperature requirement protein A [Staphylococcus lugdunensis]MCI2835410.1 low temperature requirement protein A [Staphylococcus lugdunensis]MCM3466434.1 low temperature requirement protein A [Staphylococcus lugdunensis]